MVGIFSINWCGNINLTTYYLDESDEEDDGIPKRKRRFQAERAAEGMEMDDDQVNIKITISTKATFC